MAPAAPAISCNLYGSYQNRFNYAFNGKPFYSSNPIIRHKLRSIPSKILDLDIPTFSNQRRFGKEIGKLCQLCQSGNLIETLELLQEEFKHDSLDTADRARAIGFLLKTCIQQKDIVTGRKLHEMVRESDELKDNEFLNTAFITMYSTCGFSNESRLLFDEMQRKRLCHWNAMVSVFTRNRSWFDAIALFIELFTVTEYKPDNFTLPCVIKASGEILDVGIGQAVHGISIKLGLSLDTFVANALITMYRRFRFVDDAAKVFEYMPERNLVSLNSLICLLSENASIHDCFYVLTVILLGEERLIPDVTTMIMLLSVCSENREVELGKMVHCFAVKMGMSYELGVINSLIDMYSKCESLSEAQILFDKNSIRNVVSWNSLIGGYAKNGDLGFCFSLLRRMQAYRMETGVDQITILNILPACLEKNELSCVKELHGYSIRNGFLQNEFLANAFVSAYARCNSIKSAENAFHHHLKTKTVNSWNALIHCYAQNGEPLLALNTFRKMTCLGLDHDPFTLSGLLFAMSRFKYLQPGKEIHGNVLRNGLEHDSFIMNSLLSLYFHCGKTLSARAVFDLMVEKTSVSWNTVVSGYTQNGNPSKAITIFREMLSIGIKPSDISIKALLGACSKLSSLKLGKQIHCFALKARLTEGTLVLPSLLDMYAKLGSIELAETVFHQTKYKDVVLCNVLISGYGNHGRGKEATEIFEEMTKWGLKPDGFTFMGVLIACNHAGMVEEGLEYFRKMKMVEHGVTVKLEHYACVVDMLGRAGRFEDAITMIVSEMPMDPDVGVWSSLVSSCRKYGELELGKVVAGKLLESSICDEEKSGNYALICDLLAECGMWGDVRKVRRRMEELGIQKEKGESWIEIGNQLCSFEVGENMSR